MKLVCRDCKFEEIVKKSNLKRCPRCGSGLISYFSTEGSKYKAPITISKNVIWTIIAFIIGTTLLAIFYFLVLPGYT